MRVLNPIYELVLAICLMLGGFALIVQGETIDGIIFLALAAIVTKLQLMNNK